MTPQIIRAITLALVCTASTIVVFPSDVQAQTQLSATDVRNKMLGSWIGQMAGVVWGAPTEFRYPGRTIPDNEVPTWNSSRINDAFYQDDLYVELPFIAALEQKGVNASWVDMGNSFKNTGYQLWHANLAGRDNLQRGVAAPWSGHYSNNLHADDIDWQIEADFAGNIAPGMVGAAKDIAWRGGHVMNYGDGVYGGVAVAAMHARAYTATNVRQVIEAGRDAAPVGSTYRAVVDDVISSYDSGKTWQQTWQMVQDNYTQGAHCPTIGAELISYGISGGEKGNIDATVNGAYVFMGLLYGNGNLEQSMKLSMQGGQDSDCNPSTVGGILGNMLGANAIPNKWKSYLNMNTAFLGSNHTLNSVMNSSMDLAREVVLMRGGTITGTGANEVWTLGSDSTEALILEQWPETSNAAPNLLASFQMDTNGKVNFNASATDANGIKSYQWFFGDLSYQTGQALSHQYLQTGEYEVLCFVTDITGNTSWKSMNVNITQVPEPASLGLIAIAANMLLRRRKMH